MRSALALAGWLAALAAAVAAQRVLSETRHELAHLGLTVIETRTLNPETGLIERVARTPDGAPVDVDELDRREQVLETLARGKMAPDLQARIEAAPSPAALLETAFWMNVPDAPDFRLVLEAARARGLGPEDARRAARDAAERFFSPRTRAFARDLAARGYAVTYTGTCWPIVIARVPAGSIAAAAADRRVNRAYHSAPRWETENNYAQPTLRTPTVHARGNTGKNSTLKVMVNDPGHVTTQNPYLPPVTLLNSGGAAYHASAVAGNICSRHPTYFGGARELPRLYSGNGTGDTNAPKVWDLAIKAGVSYGNCSWWNFKKGRIEFLDRFFDYTIRNFGVMMFKSTGNQGRTSTPYTTTPGNGYNVTNSGCYNDGNTWDWRDDKMASYSSYWDPVEGHEKPELASPGDGVTTTYYRSPWIRSGFGGTSSASPLTCGVAALLGSRDANLRTHTWTLKAILMASAWHNVEGDPVLSEKDGAGGVHAGAADAVVRDRQYVDGTLTAASFPGGKKDVPVVLQAGDETRVVVLWFSKANSTYSADRLEMDLDLVVLDPANRVVASSANTKNPFEIVAFVPRASGTYTVRLVKQRFQGTSEPFAVAWSNREDMATAEVQLTGSGRIGTTMTATFLDRYHPGATYVAGASLGTLPAHVALPEGHIAPLAPDALFWASIFGAFPGFTGTLDGSGKASGRMAIPNLPALKGVDIHVAVATFRSGGGDLVKGTSPAARFRIS